MLRPVRGGLAAHVPDADGLFENAAGFGDGAVGFESRMQTEKGIRADIGRRNARDSTVTGQPAQAPAVLALWGPIQESEPLRCQLDVLGDPAALHAEACDSLCDQRADIGKPLRADAGRVCVQAGKDRTQGNRRGGRVRQIDARLLLERVERRECIAPLVALQFGLYACHDVTQKHGVAGVECPGVSEVFWCAIHHRDAPLWSDVVSGGQGWPKHPIRETIAHCPPLKLRGLVSRNVGKVCHTSTLVVMGGHPNRRRWM